MTDNRLLRALPDAELRALQQHLEPMEFPLRHVVWEAHTPIREVVFPHDCVVSLITVMSDGEGVESATVGWEGVAGLPLAMGASSTASRAVVQVPGRGARMSATVFRELVGSSATFRDHVYRLNQAIYEQTAQSAACNRLHSVEQRCARWLLMTAERARSDSFPLTQEFLATMLGVRRAGVTVVAGELQRTGLIRYRRGHVEILDHAGLEAVSCECYRTVRSRYDELWSMRPN
jgi:CRP-like cAMP-binding protein